MVAAPIWVSVWVVVATAVSTRLGYCGRCGLGIRLGFTTRQIGVYASSKKTTRRYVRLFVCIYCLVEQ